MRGSAAVVEKARKQSVSRDVIERAIKKGAGIGGEKLELGAYCFRRLRPEQSAVIVEVQTDNKNRTAPEIRVLFKRGQLGAPGATSFSSITSGWSTRIIPMPDADAEAAAIEAGAQDFLVY